MTAATPEERVTAFQQDYLQAWEQAKPLFEPGDDGEIDWQAFDTWRPLIDEVTARHTTPGTNLGLGGSFGGDPKHDASKERITGTVTEGDAVLVQAALDARFGVKHREYELVPLDDDWRIRRIGEYFEDPANPFCAKDKLDDLTAAARTDAPLRPLPAVDRQVDFAQLFVERDVVDGDGDESRIEVRRVGEFTSASGILTVVDFGYDDSMLRALARRVEPGTFTVDVALAYGRCAALRVTLAPGEPATWHPAADTEGGYVAGVDAGNLAVLDLPAYAAVTVRDKERAYDRFVMDLDQDSGLLLAFGGGDPIGAVSASGWGDGAYPVYWGADASGRPVQLLIDYLVLSQPLEETITLPWADGALPSPALADVGMAVRTETRRKLVRSTSYLVLDNENEEEVRFEVLDERGTPVLLEPVADDDSETLLVHGKPGPGWTVRVTGTFGRTLI